MNNPKYLSITYLATPANKERIERFYECELEKSANPNGNNFNSTR
ncbi:hypothetical protein [Moraxella nonliquefaciens]|nr:hypothetical protein [Moraxella nonliquefaciens]